MREDQVTLRMTRLLSVNEEWNQRDHALITRSISNSGKKTYPDPVKVQVMNAGRVCSGPTPRIGTTLL